MMEAYLDIETTGLSPDTSQITVVGIYIISDGMDRFVQLVGKRITAERIMDALVGIEVLHTYNGSRFDLPFIHAKLGIDLAILYRHCDLMFDCWHRKLYGGLKKVERALGIERKLPDVNGFEAVRLWWRYVNNYDQDALRILCEYNKEDVVNLRLLKEKVRKL